MRTIAPAIVLGLVLAAGCSKKKSGDSSVSWDNVCDKYADQCSDKSEKSKAQLAGEKQECMEYCTASRFKEKLEMCAFMYCGVKIGVCDNDESEDTAIIECINEQGWKL